MYTRTVAITDCDHVSAEDDLISAIGEYSVAGNRYAPFTKRVYSQPKNLKPIVRYGVGVNDIDVSAATNFRTGVTK